MLIVIVRREVAQCCWRKWPGPPVIAMQLAFAKKSFGIPIRRWVVVAPGIGRLVSVNQEGPKDEEERDGDKGR